MRELGRQSDMGVGTVGYPANSPYRYGRVEVS